MRLLNYELQDHKGAFLNINSRFLDTRFCDEAGNRKAGQAEPLQAPFV